MPTMVRSRVRPHWLSPSIVESGNGLGRRVERVPAVVQRAQQALFFRRHGEKQHGSAGRHGRLAEGARKFDQSGGSAGVVGRAVEDPIALEAFVAAEMIPVSNIDEDFVRRLAALCPGGDVERVDPANLVADRKRTGHTKRDRLEVSNGRLLFFGLEIKSGHLEDRLGRGPLNPSLKRGPAQVVVRSRQVERFAVGRRTDHLPRITGRPGFMNDKRPCGAQFRCDLMLVHPAPVVGHRRTAEDVVQRRIVDQEQENLAAEIRIAEIIPVVLGCASAIAHEDELRAPRRPLRRQRAWLQPRSPHPVPGCASPRHWKLQGYSAEAV